MNNHQHRVLVHPRHWMHIWKVGYTRCADCRADSRFVATFIDERNEIVEQKNYCAQHVPEASPDPEDFIDDDDLIAHLNFGLGFSIEEGGNE